MRKKLLSLALALVLTLSLALPVLAAEAPKGETKVYTDEAHGVTLTMEGFLKEEKYRLRADDYYSVYTFLVVTDNSKVTVEAIEGRKYYTSEADEDPFYEEFFATNTNATYAWMGGAEYFWDDVQYGASVLFPGPLEGPTTLTVSPTADEEDGYFTQEFSVCLICESDFTKLKPVEGTINAADWTVETLLNACDAGLFPSTLDPFDVDCNKNISRAQFAGVAVELYKALGGSMEDVGYKHSFTDVELTDTYNVGWAYNLGFVNGIDATHFDPDSPLTREMAAVILGRVYAKLHEAIPEVTATTFADDNAVSLWAKSGVAFMASKGFVNGIGDNLFAPQRNLSIQEAIVIAYRMYEKLK